MTADGWRATYRVQLTATTTFAVVESLVPYLADLGISHLYLSPVLEAVAGSTHGYDGTDPTTVSHERGGEAALRRLAEVAHEHRLGLLVDLVPNHLAASDETPWWADPVERARVFDVDDEAGWYRRFFDIDHPGPGGRMTLTARDVVVLAALDDWIDQRDHGHSGGTAVIGEPLRSDLIAEIRRVPWGEEVVASSLYNGTVVTSAPRWQCVTAASPSLTDPTDG